MMKLEGRKERELKLSEEVERIMKELSVVQQGDIEEDEEQGRSVNSVKDEIISVKGKVLGQMFKGRILFGELTFRNGDAYYFKHRYKVQFNEVKTFILRMLPYMKNKLTNDEKDILELLFQREFGGEELTKSIELGKKGIKVAYTNEENNIRLVRASRLYLSDTGNVYVEDEHLSNTDVKAFYQHYAEQIAQLKSEWKERHNEILAVYDKQLEELKDKCGHYLVLANVGRKANEKD